MIQTGRCRRRPIFGPAYDKPETPDPFLGGHDRGSAAASCVNTCRQITLLLAAHSSAQYGKTRLLRVFRALTEFADLSTKH
jgi:hypothetical protein